MKVLLLVMILLGLASCGGQSDQVPEESENESLLSDYIGVWETDCVDVNTLGVSIDPPLFLQHSYSISEQRIHKTIGIYDDSNCLEYNSDIASALGALGISVGEPFSFDVESVAEYTTADGFDVLKVTLTNPSDVTYLLMLDGFLYDFQTFSFPEIFYEGNEDDLVANFYLPYSRQ